MTRTDVFAAGTGRHRIPNLNFAIGDDDAVDEQFDPWSLLLEGGRGQARTDALAEVLNVCHQGGQFVLTIDLSRQLLRLGCQCLMALLQFVPSAFVFGQRHDPAQIGFGETVQLVFQIDASTAQVLLTSLQFLWQPAPTQRSCHGLSEGLRVGEENGV
jgi:hypothetical protein